VNPEQTDNSSRSFYGGKPLSIMELVTIGFILIVLVGMLFGMTCNSHRERRIDMEQLALFGEEWLMAGLVGPNVKAEYTRYSETEFITTSDFEVSLAEPSGRSIE
jgi:hypothetical protein